jgi:colanic acid biosynthesis protein WcaH
MISKLISKLEKQIKSPRLGLPEEIFLFISRITPLVNVDLYINDNKKGVLLTWRKKGERYPEGWHFPGGILRYQEDMKSRIHKVAMLELKAKISVKKNPLSINQIILPQKNRSHFISFLYQCRLKSPPKIAEYKNKERNIKVGSFKWFKRCPKKLIKPHLVYKDLFSNTSKS